MLKFNHRVFYIVHVAKSGGIQMISNGQQCSNCHIWTIRFASSNDHLSKLKLPAHNIKNIKYNIYIGVQIQICDAKAAHHLQLEQCVHARMRRGQMKCAIGISNSNQSDLVQCVYITTCSFPNHTAHISVIFMHAWVSNIRISYSNI